MKISVVVATADKMLSSYVGLKKTSMVAPEVRRRNFYSKHTIVVSSLVIDAARGDVAMHDYLDTVATDSEGVILICDKRFSEKLSNLSEAFCIYFYDNLHAQKNAQNYLTSIISRALKCFEFYSEKFDNQSTRRHLILPLKNFSGSEVVDLVGLFRDGLNNNTFARSLERTLVQLRKRQRPKRETNFSTVYIVDDRDHHFFYGHERHSRIETSVPPHSHDCEPRSSFRFGRRYDNGRHFNVSKDGSQIAGKFVDCHGTALDIAPCSHINMFPNGFCC